MSQSTTKIESTPTTETPAKPVKVKKEPKPLNTCWSGSGRLTKNRFAPGMDARFHGWAKKVARGEMTYEDGVISLDGEIVSTLLYDEARENFESHVADERPKAKLRQDQEALKVAERAAVKAQRDADKAAAKVQKDLESVENEVEVA